MQKENKEDLKLIFSERITSVINALSLLLTYIVIGILLYVNNNFFGTVTKAIIIAFIVVGFLGIIVESRKLNLGYKIKGLENVVISCFLLVLLYLAKTYVKTSSYSSYLVFIYQMLLFFLLLISVFLFCKGIVSMIYSISIRSKNKGLGMVVSSIFIMISQLIALGILGLQIFQTFFK